MAQRKKAPTAVDAAPVQPKRQTENPLVLSSVTTAGMRTLPKRSSNLLTDASGGILKSFLSFTNYFPAQNSAANRRGFHRP